MERTRARSKQKLHSGQGHLLGNILAFAVMLACFLGSVYSLSFLTLDNPWPMAVCLVLFFLAYFIPQQIMGRSDSHQRERH
jgi:hypothetical protein